MTYTKYKENMISCAVVQDLMPSYIDGLLSEETSELMEEHIKECADCKEMLEHMRAGEDSANTPDEMDRKEIDFLKKSRNQNRRTVVIGIIAALLVAAAAAGLKQFVIGSEYRGNLACDITTEGRSMTVGATAADSVHVIRSMDFTMEDGVVRGNARAVMPGLYHSSGTFTEVNSDEENVGFNIVTCDWSGSFNFDEDIREIWIGDRLYWANGGDISARTAAVFSSGHDYVGDAPANGALLNALGMTQDLGSLNSELETDKEPYAWIIVLDEDQTRYRPDYLEKRLDGYGYVLLGTVGNLGEVRFRYTSEGKTITRTVTTDDATEFLGKDIKICREDAGALAELMEKSEIEK